MRRRFCLVFGGALVWGLDWRRGGEDPSLTRVLASGRLRVGLDPSYPPFASVDGSGRLDGFDVEVARDLAARLGVAAELVTLDAGGLVEAVIARTCDVAVGVSPIRDFLKDLRYSRPYFQAGQVLVTRRGESRVKGPDLQVAVESGSTADLKSAVLKQRLDGAQIRRATSVDALHAELKAGQVNGVLLDAVSAFALVKADPELALASDPLTSESYVVATNENDARLLQEVNTVLGALDGEGELERLTDKWLR